METDTGYSNVTDSISSTRNQVTNYGPNDTMDYTYGLHPNYDYGIDYYYYGSYDYDYSSHLYEIFEFEIPIYGYIWPLLVIFTTCCNILVIASFLRKRMRNATNLILVFIAVSDSLTGLVTLPATFHIFSKENYVLTKEWCDVSMITRLYISRAFHTISIWETLLLGAYRFIQIRKPEMARKLCTVPKTLTFVLLLYVLSFMLHVYHAFDIKAADGLCQWAIREPCGWTCGYIWLTLLLCHVLPSLILVALAINMVRTLKQITKHRHVDKRPQYQRNITVVVILVVVIFLVPELPYGLFYLTTVSLRHAGKRIFQLRTNRLIHCIYELLLVLSFHLNFWVYCVMIKSFRSCIKNVLRFLTCRPVNFERLEGEASSSTAGGLELVGMTTTDTEQI